MDTPKCFQMWKCRLSWPCCVVRVLPICSTLVSESAAPWYYLRVLGAPSRGLELRLPTGAGDSSDFTVSLPQNKGVLPCRMEASCLGLLMAWSGRSSEGLGSSPVTLGWQHLPHSTRRVQNGSILFHPFPCAEKRIQPTLGTSKFLALP